jgi:phosphatidylethanolamine/phosphatidyl-N-methylethanolamine N-methyltransferase
MKESTTLSKTSDGPSAKPPRGAKVFLKRLRPGFREYIQFLGAFLRHPACVGALGPSSTHLAKVMVNGHDLERCSTVVELGPGTGAFTVPILSRIGKSTLFFALELDAAFTRSLKVRFPSLTVYNDSAERLGDYLALHERTKADYIVSGLPWASLPLQVQDRIFAVVLSSLSPGGVFATFGYVHARWLPNAKKFRRRLEESFSRVETSRVVWKNFPPAFVYRCTR